MKITDIEAIKISIPAARFESALGVFPTFDYGIVIVHTDEGLEGLGKSPHFGMATVIYSVTL